jgi:hypothetical protein
MAVRINLKRRYGIGARPRHDVHADAASGLGVRAHLLEPLGVVVGGLVLAVEERPARVHASRVAVVVQGLQPERLIVEGVEEVAERPAERLILLPARPSWRGYVIWYWPEILLP